jgi:hypothetical protein
VVSTQTVTTLTIGGIAGTFTTTTAAQQTLSVNVAGTGNGGIASTSPSSAIACPSACTADFNPGVIVTLVATPSGSSFFAGWSGDCSGTGSCQVTMDASRFVTATFTAGPVLQSVSSRKTHTGVVPDFDVNVDYTADINAGITVEPRGGTHKLVFTFDMPITSVGGATSVDAASQAVGSANPVNLGNTVEVTLAAIPNNQRVRVTITGINGGATASASLAFVLGDVDGTRSVTASDILRAKGHVPQTTDGLNFVHDVDLSGTVSNTDVTAVQGNSGSQI